MSTPCDCVANVNRKLADHEFGANTMLETNTFGPPMAMVATCKRDPSKRGKAKAMFATYCPFCGAKYANPQPPFLGERP